MSAGNLCGRTVHMPSKTDEDARDCAPLLISRFEDARCDEPAAIDDERARKRISVEFVLRVDCRVENAVALNRF